MQPAPPQITKELLEQNPGLAAFLLFFVAIVSLAAAGSLTSWILVFVRGSRSQPILPLVEPWEPRRWAFIDLIVIAITIVAFQVVFADLYAKAMGIPRGGKLSLQVAAAGGAGGLFAVVLAIAWIRSRYRSTLSHVGFDSLNLSNILVGIVGGLLGLPVVYILMGIVSVVSNTKYNHPLVDSASESGMLLTYLCGFFAAAIVAPIIEEFFFRVLLQGWLQSIPFKSFQATFVGEHRSSLEPAANNSALQSSSASVGGESQGGEAQDGATATGLSQNGEPEDERLAQAYHLPSSVDNAGQNASVKCATPGQRTIPPIWPSVVTGILFGLMHIGYGMSFIPLSVLGVFLGLIYRQTQSVWPCIIIHMMLNGFSMLALAQMILLKNAAN